MFKRKFQPPVAGAAATAPGTAAARRAFLPPLRTSAEATPAAEAEPSPAATAIPAAPCATAAAPPAAGTEQQQQQQAVTPAAKSSGSGSGNAAASDGDAAQPTPPPPSKPKGLYVTGLRGKRKAAEPAIDGGTAEPEVATAVRGGGAAPPAPTAAAAAAPAAPAAAKGWVVKRLPAVPAPGDLPPPPALPSAKQLLGE